MSEVVDDWGTGRFWRWPTGLAAYRHDLAAMLAGSVADEGILGYSVPVTAQQAEAFCDDLDRRVASGESLVLIGEDAIGVFAMCVVTTNTMPNCRHLCEVSKVYFDPRVRGTGAVAELGAAVGRRLRDECIERLQIDVRENSPAHRTWLRFGFRSFGVLDDYSRVGGVTYRGHFMTMTVEELNRIVDGLLARRKAVVDSRPRLARPLPPTDRTTT